MLGLWGCAPTLPQQPVQRALVRDLARAVETRDQLGWMADELDVAAMLPDALNSACRVESIQRRATLQWLQVELARMGAPIEQAYIKNAASLSGLEDM